MTDAVREKAPPSALILTDAELLRRAVKNVRPARVCSRWVAVMDLFALGSTSAFKLCNRVGVDPDEKARPVPR